MAAVSAAVLAFPAVVFAGSAIAVLPPSELLGGVFDTFEAVSPVDWEDRLAVVIASVDCAALPSVPRLGLVEGVKVALAEASGSPKCERKRCTVLL